MWFYLPIAATKKRHVNAALRKLATSMTSWNRVSAEKSRKNMLPALSLVSRNVYYVMYLRIELNTI